ncbi:MAG TPA: 4-hydroxythreonine-4-phosphate dehydrogenase PdxA [Bacteroidia bacterium]|nr:4-hydroxythreonine-4-phosphate dehydrogenase PdxA [Bacteroidia bacterium]
MSNLRGVDERVRVGITIGDINGVGPEIIINTFTDNRMHQVCTPVIYGQAKVLSFYRKVLNNNDFNFTTIHSIGEINDKKTNVINCWEEEVKIDPGVASPTGGKYAFTALQAACKDLADGNIDVLVTAPIDKKTMQQEGFRFPGHTEYLAQQFPSPSHLMMLVSGKMRIATVTGHIPVKQVAGDLSKDKILSCIQTMHRSLKRDFGIRKPKIAVLGLNPHSGDSGLIGNEETAFIKPAIQSAFDEGILAYGPYAADGFFGSSKFTGFDGILAMYHDQGLVPFKAIAFETGVNFTAGLPIVRTSPDHGTAYDIAGKNCASEESFRSAIYAAIDIFNERKEYDSITSNPLKYSKLGGDR